MKRSPLFTPPRLSPFVLESLFLIVGSFSLFFLLGFRNDFSLTSPRLVAGRKGQEYQANGGLEFIRVRKV